MRWYTVLHVFDVVLCMGAFYHIGNEERKIAMIECLRVLKPKGLLVISYIKYTCNSIHTFIVSPHFIILYT